MKISVSAGHNPAGKVASGAVGVINESTEARRVTQRVIELLRHMGHDVHDCTCNDGTSIMNVLDKIIAKCNVRTNDLNISIHFNAAAYDLLGDGRSTGTEVLVTGTNTIAKTYASKVTSAIATHGLKNRGVKNYPNLRFLKETKGPSILIEVCFVDDKDDANIYNKNFDNICIYIVEAITGKKYTPPVKSEPEIFYKLQCGVFKDIKNAEFMQAKLKTLGYNSIIVKEIK